MPIERIVDLVTGIKTAELKHANAVLKTEAADLIAEKKELNERVNTLLEEIANPLIFKEGFYYSADDEDNKYPYCPACYETAKQRVHLVKHTMKCPACGADFKEPTGPYVMTGSTRWRAEDVMNGY